MQPRILSVPLTCITLFLLATSAWSGGFDRPVPADGGPTIIRSALAVLDVDEISSVQQNFTLNLAGAFRWNDPRLAHKGSGIIKKDLKEIWSPRLFLMNKQRSWSNFPDVAEIAPNGDVTYRMFLWGDFSQPLDLRDFPMDQHTFRVPMIAIGSPPDEVLLMSDPDVESFISKGLSVPDWTISNAKGFAEIYDERGISRSVFTFEFDAARKYGFYIIKSIIPLFMIVAMSWVVFWIDPKESGSQLAVAVTTVLTLIAYHIALSAKLPDIHYLTRMDKFLFSSTVLVFASLVEVVITSRLASSERLQQARHLDEIARWIFPGLAILASVWAFII